jgi:hypothetical protein
MDERIAGLAWRKSSASVSNGQCVEVAPLQDGGVAMRDTKHRNGPTLLFSHSQWADFVEGMKAGEFDALVPTSASAAE